MKGTGRLLTGMAGCLSYDNLTTAVRKALQGHNRKESRRRLSFLCSHYLFEARFASVGRPREEGKVESLVGYVRRNYFVPIPRVKSYEERQAKSFLILF